MIIRTLNLGSGFWSYQDKVFGLVASILVHGTLLTVGGSMLFKPVKFGVDTGVRSVELYLVAAPAQVVHSSSVVPETKIEKKEYKVVKTVPQIIKKQEDIIVKDQAENNAQASKECKTTSQIIEKKNAVLTAKDDSRRGDGSSSIPGENKSTFHSSGGALSKAKPNYLSNPAPAYPYLALQRGYEGEVVLLVAVNKNGVAEDIKIFQSSGYNMLDSSAIKTVRKWRFEPAKLLGTAVDSEIEIPVKFELATQQGRAG